jgi:UbiD family decarboxylase
MMAVIISANEKYPGYVHTLSSAIWASKSGIYRPIIIVVGEDVDPSNSDEVLWALTTRVHPVRDIHIKERAPGSPLFPFLSAEERATLNGAVVCYDATFPFEWKEKTPQIVDFQHAFSKEIQQLVLLRWKEYGF